MLARAVQLSHPPALAGSTWPWPDNRWADDWRDPLMRAEQQVADQWLVEVARCWLAGGQRKRAEQLLDHRCPTTGGAHYSAHDSPAAMPTAQPSYGMRVKALSSANGFMERITP